jgi:hypothetical protein
MLKRTWNAVVASNVKHNDNAAIARTAWTVRKDGIKTPVLGELPALFYQPTGFNKFAVKIQLHELNNGVTSVTPAPQMLSGGIAALFSTSPKSHSP